MSIKNAFRVGNPAFGEKTFEKAGVVASDNPMTLKGTIGKSFILLAILIASAVVGWQIASPVVMIGSALLGLGIAVFLAFKKEFSAIGAPVYAIVEGIFVGALSAFVNDAVAKTDFKGAVPVAIAGTMVVFAVMLGLYVTRVIKVTETFKAVIVGATVAVAITYLGSFLLSFLWKGVYDLPIYGSGPIGIIFSVIVIALAAFNLALDFDLIEQGVDSKFAKYMEWYCGFALLVTLVWLYIEILRLLLKLSRR